VRNSGMRWNIQNWLNISPDPYLLGAQKCGVSPEKCQWLCQSNVEDIDPSFRSCCGRCSVRRSKWSCCWVCCDWINHIAHQGTDGSQTSNISSWELV
jgi:hypothetical protein